MFPDGSEAAAATTTTVLWQPAAVCYSVESIRQQYECWQHVGFAANGPTAAAPDGQRRPLVLPSVCIEFQGAHTRRWRSDVPDGHNPGAHVERVGVIGECLRETGADACVH